MTPSVAKAFDTFVAASRPMPSKQAWAPSQGPYTAVTAFVSIDHEPIATTRVLMDGPSSAHQQIHYRAYQHKLDEAVRCLFARLADEAPILGAHGMLLNEVIGSDKDKDATGNRTSKWRMTMWHTFVHTNDTPALMGRTLTTLATRLSGIQPGTTAFTVSGVGRMTPTSIMANSREDATRIWETIVGLEHPQCAALRVHPTHP